MNNILSLVIFFFIIGLVIFIHELGHFLLAKKNGVAVTEFNIGMGPDICSVVKNGTKYCLKWIPFGGACVMLGDDNGIPDADAEKIEDEKAFSNKSVWVRISVIVAGPVFNFLLAFVLAIIVISVAGTDKSIIQGTIEGLPTEQAGIQAGDEIIEINGESIHFYREILIYLRMNPGKELNVTYVRDGKEYQTVIQPAWDEESNSYLMGIQGYANLRYDVGVLDTLKYSLYEVKYNIVTTIKSLGMIFKGQFSINDLSGPVGIAGVVDDMVDDVVEHTKEETFASRALTMFLTMANFVILISANLGVMNLLPLPALDGGRLVFLLIEAVRGKPIAREKEGMVHVVGFVLLMALMVIVLFNDVRKLFF